MKKALGMQTSDHFDGKVFFNPWNTYRKKSYWDVLKWKTEANPYRQEKKNVPVFPIVPHQIDYSAEKHSHATVTWVGHSTVLVQLDGVNILTDPIWGSHALVHRRITPPAVSWSDLPPIDAVIISHNHYDHLDKYTVKKLGNGTRFFVPKGMKKWFSRIGISNVVELDWWEQAEYKGIKFCSVPTQHWCARGLLDRDRVLWSGWVAAGGSRQFYYSGDTGYFEGFKEIGKRFPEIDLAILPIGHYEPRWFMKPYHVNGQEALQAFQDLKARQFMGVHWGTFDLTNEPLDLPPKVLREEVEQRGFDPARYWVFAHGETRRL